MKLTNSDLKLLGSLYHSNREPFTKIAKATKLTRKQVEYKLAQYEKEGLVKKFLTMFNYGVLGYKDYAFLLLKLEKFGQISSIIKELDKSKNCISWGECFGKYDLFVNLIFKNEKEINIFLDNLHGKVIIADSVLVKPYLAEFHPLKIFGENSSKIIPITFPEEKEVSLTKEDIQILKMLEENGRVRVVDIANKLNISGELALYKLKKLYEARVIVGSRIQLDMKKAGYNYSQFLLNIKNLSEQTRKNLIEFARKNKRVNALVLSIMKPNCLIQVFHETENELKEVILEVKELLKNELFDLDVLLINEEEKINTLPFFNA